MYLLGMYLNLPHQFQVIPLPNATSPQRTLSPTQPLVVLPENSLTHRLPDPSIFHAWIHLCVAIQLPCLSCLYVALRQGMLYYLLAAVVVVADPSTLI